MFECASFLAAACSRTHRKKESTARMRSSLGSGASTGCPSKTIAGGALSEYACQMGRRSKRYAYKTCDTIRKPALHGAARHVRPLDEAVFPWRESLRLCFNRRSFVLAGR